MTPTNVAYGTAQGRISAGRFLPDEAGYNALIATIAGWPGNSWHKLNNNKFSDAWLPDDLRNDYGSPAPIMYAWPSGACDTKRHQFILWGGGHANTTANEPYAFDYVAGLWRCLFLPSLCVRNGDGVFIDRSVDGNASPPSSHTYFGNVYLSVLDRFFTRGGPSHSGAAGPAVIDSNGNRLRPVVYTLNPELGGLNFVGGATGAHSHRGAYASVNYHGARAWRQRDWYANSAWAALLNSALAVNGGAVATVENGRDVLYLCGQTIGGFTHILRVELADQDWRHDSITLVAGPGGASGQGCVALDTTRQLLLNIPGADAGTRPAGTIMQFIDLKRPHGASNPLQPLTEADFSGPVSSFLDAFTPFVTGGGSQGFGLVFDPNVGKFVFGNGGAQVYYIAPPAGDPTPATGWAISAPAVTGGVGMDPANGPLQGKMRYAADIGCTLIVQDASDGNVWAYKPAEWVDPRS